MNLRKWLLPLVAPAFMLAACGGGDDSLDDRIDVADPKVRFVHAIPLGPDVTLFRNSVAQSDANAVGYKYASKYFDVETGPAQWTLRTSTGNVDIGSFVLDASRGNKYTVVALPGSTAADLLVIDDPYNKGVTADNARVRAVNASFNAANVDVYLTAPTADLATAVPNFQSVGYKTPVPASGQDSVDVDGGTYRLRITEAGTKRVVFDADVTLGDNADWLILTVPANPLPDAVKVLVVKADDDARTTLEIESR